MKTSKVPKVPELKECKCGKMPIFHHWSNNKSYYVFIECSCGMMTRCRSSNNSDVAKKDVITGWNKKAIKRTLDKKTGLKSCEKCGAKAEFYDFEDTYMVRCSKCGIQTDELDPNGNIRSEKEIKQLWNK